MLNKISNIWPVLLALAVVVAGGVWQCCAITPGLDSGAMASSHHADAPLDHHGNGSPHAGKGSDAPLPRGEHPHSDQCQLVFEASGLSMGPISFVGNPSFPNLLALNRSVGSGHVSVDVAWRVGVNASLAGTFGGDSLRALSCLLTI